MAEVTRATGGRWGLTRRRLVMVDLLVPVLAGWVAHLLTGWLELSIEAGLGVVLVLVLPWVVVSGLLSADIGRGDRSRSGA